MPYNIVYADGNIPVPDGSLNSNLSIQLPGRNYAGYGQYINQNLVDLLEHFARSTPAGGPTNPIRGQLWYNTTTDKLLLRTKNVSTNTAEWVSVLTSSGGGNITFSGLTVDPGPLIVRDIRTHATNALTTGTLTGQWSLPSGSTLQATYADLAEKHHSDAEYPVGTLVKVGGVNEITIADSDDHHDVIGVVSNTAGFVLNADAGDDTTHPKIAIVGRVLVRVIGAITKGDKITTAGNGCAKASTTHDSLGWALATDTNEQEKLVLCVIK